MPSWGWCEATERVSSKNCSNLTYTVEPPFAAVWGLTGSRAGLESTGPPRVYEEGGPGGDWNNGSRWEGSRQVQRRWNRRTRLCGGCGTERQSVNTAQVSVSGSEAVLPRDCTEEGRVWEEGSVCGGCAKFEVQSVNSLPAVQETTVQSLWLISVQSQGDLPEKEMANHSSILAWKIPWTEEPEGPQSMGSHESDTT